MTAVDSSKAVLKRSISSYWTLLIGVILIFSGLFVIIYYEKPNFTQKLLFGGIVEVGFAFVIAWVVGQTVERTSREEYNRYVQNLEQSVRRNVLMYFFDVDVTKDVYKIVTDHVLTREIIKTYQSNQCRLALLEEHSGWLKMECIYRYGLRNISRRPVWKELVVFSSSPEGIDAPLTESFGFKVFRINNKDLSAKKLENPEHSIGHKTVRHHVEIKPDEEITVEVVFVQPKLINDSDVFQTIDTCRRMEIKVLFDPGELNVFVEPLHPKREFNDILIDDAGIRVVMSEPSLPANGYLIYWSAKGKSPHVSP